MERISLENIEGLTPEQTLIILEKLATGKMTEKDFQELFEASEKVTIIEK